MRCHFATKSDLLKLTERKIDPSVVEDLPVAAVDVVEGLDESGVDRSLDGHSTGSPFALPQDFHRFRFLQLFTFL